MLDHGYTGVGFHEISDLRQAPDLQAMRHLVTREMPGEKMGAIGNYAAQLNAFANKIAIGDIVVLPRTRDGILAFGIVTGEYEY